MSSTAPRIRRTAPTVAHQSHPENRTQNENHHEHGWVVESRHATSQGCVLYVICEACGTRRVDLQEAPAAPPGALSVEVRP